MKRIFFIIITAALLFALSATAAFAMDSNENSAQADTIASDEVLPDAAANENVFDTAFNAISSHAGEILSALSALLSGIVIFAYRKGILPMLSGGLSAVENEVKEIEEHSKNQSESTDAISEALNQGLADTNELLKEMDSRILTAENTYKSAGDLLSVLSLQIEMLSEIFMSSSLPAYEKERVAERIAKMKSAISSKTGEEENV